MKNLWNNQEVEELRASAGDDAADILLAERIYTSRLLGREPDLVLHGGGNTSVKVNRTWGDGSNRRTLHVKGSGWDLATIEAQGLPSVDLEPLLVAKSSGKMSDAEMVALLRANLMDADAPNPSLEALLHAFIPHRFVDHTHSLPILILANQPNAEELWKEIFGDDLAFVPYVMPGFDLSIAAAAIYDENRDCTGMFLKNHGLFTFSDDAYDSYRLTIDYTTRAEKYLREKGCVLPADMPNEGGEIEGLTARLKQTFGDVFPNQAELFFDYREDANTRAYTSFSGIDDLSRRGTVTPDHVIRIKPFSMICEENASVEELKKIIAAYADSYAAYFNRHAPSAAEEKTMLSPLPKAVLVRNKGIYGIDDSAKSAAIVADLMVQTSRAALTSEKFGRFQPISESDLFDMEYWSLEQAKLKKS